MIHEAIKKDDQPEIFEALLANVRNYMIELERTRQLDAISVTL